MSYRRNPVSEEDNAEQKASYAALLQNLGRASFEEIEQALAEREQLSLKRG
jgi:hypothetical protein